MRFVVLLISAVQCREELGRPVRGTTGRMRIVRTVLACVLLAPITVFAQSTREDWLNAREKTVQAVEKTKSARTAQPDALDLDTAGTESIGGVLSLTSWRSFPDVFGNDVVVGE